MNDTPGTLTAMTAELHALRQRVTELEAQHAADAGRERLLRQQAEEIADLYNNAPCGYHSLDVDGVVIRINDTELQWLGYQREEVLGRMKLTEFLTDASRQIFRANFSRFKERGFVHDLELELRRKDGTIVPVLVSATAVTDATGHFVHSWSVVYNLTARKEAEHALRMQAEILDQTYDAVITTDLDGFITSCNQGGEQMFGYTRQELCGQSVLLLFPEEDRAAYAPRVMVPLLAHGRHEFETRQLRKSGEMLYCHVSLSLLRQPDGTPQGIVGFAVDVTALRKAEAWLEGLIAATQDAVISIDRHARIVRFNPAAEQIFGYSAVEVVGEKVNLLMPEPYAHEHDGYIARYEETHEPQAIGRIRTVTGKRKSGEVFPIELSVTKIGVDEEVHYAACIRDISEKVRLQEKVIEHERLAAIGVTAAKLAHEIGNPLNGMALSAQMLERRLVSANSDDKSIERVRGLREQMNRLTQLLQEFRNLSRRQDYRLMPTDLPHLVTEVLTADTDHYAARGVTIVHESAPDLPLIKADADKLRQVLVNLCKNAVEAMPEGGTLTVQGQRNGNNRVDLHISDTGSGIPEGVNIFEPFITTKPEGTGLGLPVVRQIVAAHEGELTFRTAPGQGTTFTVTLVAVHEATRSLTDTSTPWRTPEEGSSDLSLGILRK